MGLLRKLLLGLTGEAHRRIIESDRQRGSRLPRWTPRTREEAEEAEEDEASLARAEKYEKSRQWQKALAIYRELARCSPVPDIAVKAKLGIKRVKREQGP